MVHGLRGERRGEQLDVACDGVPDRRHQRARHACVVQAERPHDVQHLGRSPLIRGCPREPASTAALGACRGRRRCAFCGSRAGRRRRGCGGCHVRAVRVGRRRRGRRAVRPRGRSTPPASPRERRAGVGKQSSSTPALSSRRARAARAATIRRARSRATTGRRSASRAGSRPGHFARRNTPSVLYMQVRPALSLRARGRRRRRRVALRRVHLGRPRRHGRRVRAPAAARPRRDEQPRARPRSRAKLRAAGYAPAIFRRVPGALDAAAPAARAGGALGEALQAFLTSEAMSPFTSKFDDYVRGHGEAHPARDARARGLQGPRARAPATGATVLRVVERAGERSLFTDYGYDARRRAAQPRRSPPTPTRRYHDLGLCERKQIRRCRRRDPKWCGAFRTPSLRNVAVRERFMHNGAFTTCATSWPSTRPAPPTPRAGTRPATKFDDVPAKYRRNVNVDVAPLQPARGRRARRSTTPTSTRSSRSSGR